MANNIRRMLVNENSKVYQIFVQTHFNRETLLKKLFKVMFEEIPSSKGAGHIVSASQDDEDSSSSQSISDKESSDVKIKIPEEGYKKQPPIFFFKALLEKVKDTFKTDECYKWTLEKLKTNNEGVHALFNHFYFNRNDPELAKKIEDLYTKDKEVCSPTENSQGLKMKLKELNLTVATRAFKKPEPEIHIEGPEPKKINIFVDSNPRKSSSIHSNEDKQSSEGFSMPAINHKLSFGPNSVGLAQMKAESNSFKSYQSLGAPGDGLKELHRITSTSSIPVDDHSKPTTINPGNIGLTPSFQISEKKELPEALSKEEEDAAIKKMVRISEVFKPFSDGQIGALKHIMESEVFPFYEEVKEIQRMCRRGSITMEENAAKMTSKSEAYFEKELKKKFPEDQWSQICFLDKSAKMQMLCKGSKEAFKNFRETGDLPKFIQFFEKAFNQEEEKEPEPQKVTILSPSGNEQITPTMGPAENIGKVDIFFPSKGTDSPPVVNSLQKINLFGNGGSPASSVSHPVTSSSNLLLSPDQKSAAEDPDVSISAADSSLIEPKIKRKVIKPNALRVNTKRNYYEAKPNTFSIKLIQAVNDGSRAQSPQKSSENQGNTTVVEEIRDLLPSLTAHHGEKCLKFERMLKELCDEKDMFKKNDKEKLESLLNFFNSSLLEILDAYSSKQYTKEKAIKALKKLCFVDLNDVSMVQSPTERVSRMNHIHFSQTLNHLKNTLGVLSTLQHNQLEYLFIIEDIAIVSAFEVYSTTEDLDDFRDTLLQIMRIKSNDKLADPSIEYLTKQQFSELIFLQQVKKYFSKTEEEIIDYMIKRREVDVIKCISDIKKKKMSRFRGVKTLSRIARKYEAKWVEFKEKCSAPPVLNAVETRCDALESLIARNEKLFDKKSIDEFMKLTQENENCIVTGIWTAFEGNADKADLTENIQIWCKIFASQQVDKELVECFNFLKTKISIEKVRLLIFCC